MRALAVVPGDEPDRRPVAEKDKKPAPRRTIAGMWGSRLGNQSKGVQLKPNDGSPENELPYTPHGLQLYRAHKGLEGADAVPPAGIGRASTGPSHFNLPTDVAFASNGDIYVTDGYGSARVVKFSRDGKYVSQWGKRGKGPGEFGLPHNLVIDRQDRVYVTDRDNQRIEVFDAGGRFLAEWTGTGGVSGLGITKDQRIWTGGVLRDLDGNLITTETAKLTFQKLTNGIPDGVEIEAESTG